MDDTMYHANFSFRMYVVLLCQIEFEIEENYASLHTRNNIYQYKMHSCIYICNPKHKITSKDSIMFDPVMPFATDKIIEWSAGMRTLF